MEARKLCPVTGTPMRPVFTHLVLGKYQVRYFFSDQSGIIQTEQPFWLEEAYRSVISELDTWTAMRNVGNARRLEPLLSLLFPADAVFVDVACGYGMLTRLMRDSGFNFFGYDKFCTNIFSQPFQAQPGTKAAAVCAFEVLEHLMDPIEFLGEQFRTYQTDTIIASTTLFAGEPPDFDWPYYSFESGQHVTIYQARSLELIARGLQCHYYRLPHDIHLLTKRSIQPWKLRVLRTKYVRAVHALMWRWIRRKRSRTLDDYNLIRKRILENDKEQLKVNQTIPNDL
jgi:hypothetical protein